MKKQVKTMWTPGFQNTAGELSDLNLTDATVSSEQNEHKRSQIINNNLTEEPPQERVPDLEDHVSPSVQEEELQGGSTPKAPEDNPLSQEKGKGRTVPLVDKDCHLTVHRLTYQGQTIAMSDGQNKMNEKGQAQVNGAQPANQLPVTTKS